MAQTGRCVHRHGPLLYSLLAELGLSDLLLDELLLPLPRLGIAPPHWSLVVTVEPQIDTCFA